MYFFENVSRLAPKRSFGAKPKWQIISAATPQNLPPMLIGPNRIGKRQSTFGSIEDIYKGKERSIERLAGFPASVHEHLTVVLG